MNVSINMRQNQMNYQPSWNFELKISQIISLLNKHRKLSNYKCYTEYALFLCIILHAHVNSKIENFEPRFDIVECIMTGSHYQEFPKNDHDILLPSVTKSDNLFQWLD
jgi:hypothetical protein